MTFCIFWRHFTDSSNFFANSNDVFSNPGNRPNRSTLTLTRNRLDRLMPLVGFKFLRPPSDAGVSSPSWVQNRPNSTRGQA